MVLWVGFAFGLLAIYR